jgi:mannitol-1-phosphate 5-dehydrogenase
LDAAEMAFRFQNVKGDEESAELAKIMSEKSPDEVVKEVCGLQPNEKLYPKVVDIVKRVQADSQEE